MEFILLMRLLASIYNFNQGVVDLKKIFAVFFSLILTLSISSSVFADNNGTINLGSQSAPLTTSKDTSEALHQSIDEEGRTTITSGTFIEGGQTRTLYFYKESEFIQSTTTDNSNESSYALKAGAISYGKLDVSISATYRTVYSGWKVTFEPGTQVSKVDLNMVLQKSSAFIWANGETRLFLYEGGYSDFEENQAQFTDVSDGYYRTKMTGRIRTINEGWLTLAPGNSSTVLVPGSI